MVEETKEFLDTTVTVLEIIALVMTIEDLARKRYKELQKNRKRVRRKKRKR